MKCLDVTDGVVNNGTKLQVWDCTDGINQQWFPSGVLFRWEGTSLLDPLCIDLTDGIVGNQVSLFGNWLVVSEVTEHIIASDLELCGRS